MVTFQDAWDDVEAELSDAKGIAFDGCHKIYVLMDDAQMTEMTGYGYGSDEGSFLVHSTGVTRSELLATVKKWYEDSCALRFVQAVTTVEGDPNKGFESLIPQGYEAEFCTDCGEYGTDYDGVCDECREDDEDECQRCGTSVERGALDSEFYCEDCADDEDEDEDE
jgi:hypothetical protein